MAETPGKTTPGRSVHHALCEYPGNHVLAMSDIPASSSPCRMPGAGVRPPSPAFWSSHSALLPAPACSEQFGAQVAHLQAQLKATPRIKYIAVLLDTAQAPAMLATFDPQERTMQLQRSNTVKEGRRTRCSCGLWCQVHRPAPWACFTAQARRTSCQRVMPHWPPCRSLRDQRRGQGVGPPQTVAPDFRTSSVEPRCRRLCSPLRPAIPGLTLPTRRR